MSEAKCPKCGMPASKFQNLYQCGSSGMPLAYEGYECLRRQLAAAIRAEYVGGDSVKTICARHKIGKDRVTAVLQAAPSVMREGGNPTGINKAKGIEDAALPAAVAALREEHQQDKAAKAEYHRWDCGACGYGQTERPDVARCPKCNGRLTNLGAMGANV